MDPVSIAQWLIDNPSQWVRVAEETACMNPKYAYQIADAFADMAYEYNPDTMHDDLDGDHASGLASAGWGTDEDYGG